MSDYLVFLIPLGFIIMVAVFTKLLCSDEIDEDGK